MKKLLCLLLLCFLLLGCTAQPEGYSFYYPRTQDTMVYGTDTSLIGPAYREVSDTAPTLADLLQLYLDGPTESGFSNPFPKGIQLLRAYRDQNTLILELSLEFSQLEGIRQTLAKACIAATCRELADVENFLILSAEESYAFSIQDFAFLDPNPVED